MIVLLGGRLTTRIGTLGTVLVSIIEALTKNQIMSAVPIATAFLGQLCRRESVILESIFSISPGRQNLSVVLFWEG